MPPTMKQRRLAREIVRAIETGEGVTSYAGAMRKAGYAEGTIHSSPGRQRGLAGVQESMEELGFTADNAKKVVTEIMLNPEEKARDRLTATDQTFKIHGEYKPEQRVNLNLNVDQAGLRELEDIAGRLRLTIEEEYADGGIQAHDEKVQARSIEESNGENHGMEQEKSTMEQGEEGAIRAESDKRQTAN